MGGDAQVALGTRDVRAALLKKIPAYMLPTRWLLLDELPKNLNGKIDRRDLRERFLAHERPCRALIFPKMICCFGCSDCLSEDVLDVPAPEPDVDIIAEGLLDSLALVTLLFEIEQAFDVRLPLERIGVDDIRTLEGLVALVAREWN